MYVCKFFIIELYINTYILVLFICISSESLYTPHTYKHSQKNTIILGFFFVKLEINENAMKIETKGVTYQLAT